MKDQHQVRNGEPSPISEIISLETASTEFSAAYGSIIAELIVAKLTLVHENTQLRDRIVKLERELNLSKQQTASN